jgi:hypothetical protein
MHNEAVNSLAGVCLILVLAKNTGNWQDLHRFLTHMIEAMGLQGLMAHLAWNLHRYTV